MRYAYCPKNPVNERIIKYKGIFETEVGKLREQINDLKNNWGTLETKNGKEKKIILNPFFEDEIDFSNDLKNTLIKDDEPKFNNINVILIKDTKYLSKTSILRRMLMKTYCLTKT